MRAVAAGSRGLQRDKSNNRILGSFATVLRAFITLRTLISH